MYLRTYIPHMPVLHFYKHCEDTGDLLMQSGQLQYHLIGFFRILLPDIREAHDIDRCSLYRDISTFKNFIEHRGIHIYHFIQIVTLDNALVQQLFQLA